MTSAVVSVPSPPGTGGRTVEVLDPATGELVGTVADAGPAEIDAAVARAAAAFPAWRSTAAPARAALLEAAAGRIRSALPELASVLTREIGKPRREAEFDVHYVAETFTYYAALVRDRAGRVPPVERPGELSLVVEEPVGVVAALTPWNFPLLLWAWKAAPALAAGNVVVAKPSPDAPLSVLRAHELLELPEGVHGVVTGGAAAGEALVAHPGVDLVAFTGRAETGKAVMRACADRVARVVLELSGNDPMIVWDDVPLDAAVEAATFGAFVFAGQVCASTERIYVAEAIADEFTERLARRAERLVVGDPADEATDVGPLAGDGQLARIAGYVEAAHAAGGTIHAGGTRVAGMPSPRFFRPTVISGVDHATLRDLGEVFGPVVAVVPVATFEEAVRLANDSLFGLGASVLTSSLERASYAARELEAGSVWINQPLLDNVAAPFGGRKQSGLGRELGPDGLASYVETKHVVVAPQLEQQDWWFSAR